MHVSWPPKTSRKTLIRTLGSSPARELASQLNTNDLGSLQFPGKVGHDVNSIGTADTDSSHTETTSIGSVRVSTDQETTGEGIVLEDDLMDDTGAGTPEANVVLCARGGEEVVDLLVDLVGAGQILGAADLGLDEMVAVDSGRGGHGGHASGHELEDGHLSGGILAGDAVGAELEVALAALDLLVMGIIQVRVEDLLGVGERAVEALADDAEVLAHLLVVDEVALPPVGHFDLLGEGGIADGSQMPLANGLANAAQPREIVHGGRRWGGEGVEWLKREEFGERKSEKKRSEATDNY